MRTVPSAWRLFSRKAISDPGRGHAGVIQGVAQLHFAIFILIADAQTAGLGVPQIGAGAHLKELLLAGDQASISQDLTFRSARSPEQHSSCRTGISRERNSSTDIRHSFSYQSLDSCGLYSNYDHLLLFQTGGCGRCHGSSMPWGTFLLAETGGVGGKVWGRLSAGRIWSMNRPIMECSLVPIRYRSSPSILYIMPSMVCLAHNGPPPRCRGS